VLLSQRATHRGLCTKGIGIYLLRGWAIWGLRGWAIWGLRFGISGLRAPNPNRDVCGHTPGPRRQRVTPVGFKQAKLPGPHWVRRVPKPLLIRSASLWLALLALGLLASLLLNFYSASLHGNSDGMFSSGDKCLVWGWGLNFCFVLACSEALVGRGRCLFRRRWLGAARLAPRGCCLRSGYWHLVGYRLFRLSDKSSIHYV
jgi:hypothetical protein